MLAGLEELKQAVTLGPDFFEARLSLARAHQLAGIYGGLDLEENRARAAEEIAAAAALDPGRPELSLERDWLAASGNKTTQSEQVELFRTAVRENPDSSSAWRGLSATLADVGKRDEAKKAMQKALNLDPRSTIALSNAASQAKAQNDLDATRNYLRRLLAIDPDFALAAQMIARTAVERGDFVEAHRIVWKQDEPSLVNQRTWLYGAVGAWDAQERLYGPRARGYRALFEGDRREAARYARLAFERGGPASAINLSDALGDKPLIREIFESMPAYSAFLTGEAPLENEDWAEAALSYAYAYRETDPETVAHLDAKLDEWAAWVEADGSDDPSDDFTLALYHARRGNEPAMHAALDRLVTHPFVMVHTTVFREFDPYRATPKFQSWVERMEAVAAEARAAILADLAHPPDPWWDPEAL